MDHDPSIDGFIRVHQSDWPDDESLQNLKKLTRMLVDRHECGLRGGLDSDPTPHLRNLCIDLVTEDMMTSNQSLVFLSIFDIRDRLWEQLKLLQPYLEAVQGEADFNVELRARALRLLRVWNLQELHLFWLHNHLIDAELYEPEKMGRVVAEARKFPNTPIEFAAEGA